MVSLAGCIGTGSSSPPPRKSNVIETVQVADGGSTLVVTPEPAPEQWVQTRRDLDVVDASTDGADTDGNSTETTARLGVLSGLSPVGVASAAKGRGATGRGAGGYSSAPKTSSGRAWFWGGGYTSTWYNNHEDEVDKYPVDINQLGIAYLGTHAQFKEQDPGPGPVTWDETYDSPDGEIETDIESMRVGWYRVGANIVVADGAESDSATDLGWECVDLRVEDTGSGPEITEEWKVSPRI